MHKRWKEAAQETLKEEPKNRKLQLLKRKKKKEVRYPNKLNAKEPENLKQKNGFKRRNNQYQ